MTSPNPETHEELLPIFKGIEGWIYTTNGELILQRVYLTERIFDYHQDGEEQLNLREGTYYIVCYPIPYSCRDRKEYIRRWKIAAIVNGRFTRIATEWTDNFMGEQHYR